MKHWIIRGIIPATLALLLFAPPAFAVPSLGVATNFAYVGGTGQAALEPYQDYFVDTFIPGTDAVHGFAIGPSGSDLIVFTNYVGPNIFLLWTASLEGANDPSFSGYSITHFGNVGGQFDGYAPADYYGINLGAVAASWTALPPSPFSPDPFFSLNVTLDYNGSIAPGEYFFAIADVNNNGPSRAGGRSNDPFSPKTTSATGTPVPEPGTMLLLGSGLVGLAAWGRKKFRR